MHCKLIFLFLLFINPVLSTIFFFTYLLYFKTLKTKFIFLLTVVNIFVLFIFQLCMLLVELKGGLLLAKEIVVLSLKLMKSTRWYQNTTSSSTSSMVSRGGTRISNNSITDYFMNKKTLNKINRCLVLEKEFEM